MEGRQMTPALDARSTRFTQRLIQTTTLWHVVAALAGLAAVVLIAVGVIVLNLPAWLRITAGVLLLVFTGASAAAAWFLRLRKRVGRTFSLVTNYLGFIVSLLALFQFLGIFTGVDALADSFGRGLWALAGVFLGYLISASGDRFHASIDTEILLKKIGKYVALASFVVFLFLVGLVDGLLYLARQLAQPAAVAALLLTLVFGFMVWALWREDSGIALNRSNAHTETLEGYLFLSPNLLGFLVFFAFPLLFSFFVSLTDWDAFGNQNFIGLRNYANIFTLNLQPLAYAGQLMTEVMDGSIFSELLRFNFFGKEFLLGAKDALFWISLRNTLLFVILTVPLSAIPALLLANILNSKIPGMKVFRAIYFVPSIAATVGIALIWQWLYNASIGYINYFITLAVTFFNGTFGAALVDPQIRWLSEARTSMLAIVIMSAWQTLGFNTVLFLAGLQNIPKEIYEAATVDGAGSWARFWNMTLPLLAPTTFFVITTTTIQAMQVFEQVFIMTNPPGAPANSTLTIVLYLYQNGFQRFRQGYAAAIAWVLFTVIFLVTLLQFRNQRRTGGGYDM